MNQSRKAPDKPTQRHLQQNESAFLGVGQEQKTKSSTGATGTHPPPIPWTVF